MMTWRSFRQLLAVAAVALALAACSDSGEGDVGHAHDEGSKVRGLNATEIDTLRRWKSELGVTRDEYWDGRGGVLANGWAEVWYPPGSLTVSHGMHVFKRVGAARSRTRILFGRVPDVRLTIICSTTLQSYSKETGYQWWQYARIEDERITFQPVIVLAKRGLVDIAPDREYYRWAIRRLSDDESPVWLEHGFASVLAGEGKVLKDNLVEFPDDPVLRPLDAVEKALKKYNVKKDSRIAGYNAFKTAEKLVSQHGEAAVAQMIAALGDGSSLDSASKRHLGEPWDDAVTSAVSWQIGWTR